MSEDTVAAIRENIRKASDDLFEESGIRAHVYESSEDVKITKDDDEDQDSYSVSYEVKLASVDAAFIGLTSQEVVMLLNFARYVLKAKSIKDYNEPKKDKAEPKECEHFRLRDECQHAHRPDIKEGIEKYGATLPAHEATLVGSQPQEIHVHVHGVDFLGGAQSAARVISDEISKAIIGKAGAPFPQGTGGPGM